MSVVLIKTALETALATVTPALATSYANDGFTPPVPTTAWQRVDVLFARPSNREMGDRHFELGFMQVRLMYRIGAGTAAMATRQELIRTTFKKGATFASGGITVLITETPEITPGEVDGSFYSSLVKIRFNAQVG